MKKDGNQRQYLSAAANVAQGAWGKDRTELVPHRGANQIAVHFHQLSVADGYFYRPGRKLGY